MGLTAAVRKLACGLLAALSRLAGFFSGHTKLHSARFARIHELISLVISELTPGTGLLLGTTLFGHALSVRPTKQRRELGNLLAVASTRGGKGLLAVSQLLTWKHSVVVNDIKGDLFAQTAGLRSALGPVFVIDRQALATASIRFSPNTQRTSCFPLPPIFCSDRMRVTGQSSPKEQ